MAELWFVGAGLGDEQDLSRRAIALLGRCGAVFAEEYTSELASGSFERLSREIGRPIERLSRAELESEGRILGALDRGGPVALIVPGDPFTATTHGSLRRSAEARGHTWSYLPNASIVTAAAGFVGLMAYKFGRIASLPFPEPAFAPTSPLEIVRANSESGLHTLVLLDLRPSEGRYLTADVAIRTLAERDGDGAVLPPTRPLVVAARIGTASAQAWFGPRELLAKMEFGAPLHALLIPARELHFEEQAALDRWRVAPVPAGTVQSRPPHSATPAEPSA